MAVLGSKTPLRSLSMSLLREPINKNIYPQPKGRVYIIPQRCKECSFCWTFCPEEVLEKSQQTNVNGYFYPRVKPGKEEDCVSCGMCSKVCPEFAIFAVEVKPQK